MRALSVLALSAAATMLSCADKPASSVVIALSSEAPLPAGVTSIRIQVERGGKSFYNQDFAVRPAGSEVDVTRELPSDKVPGTLTLSDDGKASGPVTVTIEATMSALASDGTPRIARRVGRAFFVDEKQRLLRMPIQFACAALGDTCSKAGQSCRAGQCVDDAQIDALDRDLEDADEAAVVPDGDRCFQKDAISRSETVAVISTAQLVKVVDQVACTVPSLFPTIKADEEVLASLRDAVRQKGSVPPASRLNELRARTNMGYVWSGSFNPDNKDASLSNARWTVIDRDPSEGWNFVHPADLTDPEVTALVEHARAELKGDTSDEALTEILQGQPELRIFVAPGLCQVLRHDIETLTNPQEQPYLLGTLEQRGTPSKDRSLPTCGPVAAAK